MSSFLKKSFIKKVLKQKTSSYVLKYICDLAKPLKNCLANRQKVRFPAFNGIVQDSGHPFLQARELDGWGEWPLNLRSAVSKRSRGGLVVWRCWWRLENWCMKNTAGTHFWVKFLDVKGMGWMKHGMLGNHVFVRSHVLCHIRQGTSLDLALKYR